MRRANKLATLALACIMGTSIALAAGQSDKVMRRLSDGTYVVNTTTLAKNVRGYRGATPLNVYIKDNRVVKVEALRNQESPKYFNKVRTKILPQYEGMKASTAAKVSAVDGVTGATFSSKAVKRNVAAAIKYYKAHK